MSTVSAIDSLMSTGSTPYDLKRPDEMGKLDFLNLLITQLQQQDPLNPQDPSEFTAQLTQFSSLEQMMALNESILNLQMLQLSANNTMAASLLGKDILYEGDRLDVAGGLAGEIRFNAPSAAQEVTVTVTNESGQVVRTIALGDFEAGTHAVEWDGKDANGNVLPDGEYRVSFTANDAAENTVSVVSLVMGRANGVIFENGAAYLDIGGEHVPLSSIFSVYEAA